VAAAAEACDEAGVPLYTDAAQSLGHGPVPPGWSLLSASARKWGGPPGVGLLVVRKGVRWRSRHPGDDLYRPHAPGALALPAVVAAAASLRAVLAEAATEAVRLSALVDRIRAEVARTVPDVEVIGHPVDRLPHLVTFSCLYVDGEALLHALDREGFAVSSGSSCTASTLRPSHVLEAMGVLSHGNVRVSLHRGTTDSDVDRFLAVLPRAGGRDPQGGGNVITLDCLGQRCPLPVIALARALPRVPVGEVVRVLADDPAAANDIPAWCRMKGQELISGSDDAYEVRRVS
jgi:cysteine desulfurase